MDILKIGENAGMVWKVLHQKGSQTSSSLKKLTGLDDKNLCLALGWLAREGKINFRSEKRSIMIDLK
jgi:predicted transcriptional regulator